MSSSFYLTLFIIVVITGIVVIFITYYNRNGNTELYREGVRNENNGRYITALQNYEDALLDIRKLKMTNKFGEKIAQRIKVLQTTIDYEKQFQKTNHS
jgi:hypothetical protein